MEKWQLYQRQNLPLDVKVELSLLKIRQWYERWDGDIYISLSGIASLVAYYLTHMLYDDVPAVSVANLECASNNRFNRQLKNVEFTYSKLKQKDAILKYGYPVISKSQSMAIRKLRTQNLSDVYRHKLLWGDDRGDAGRLSAKYHYLLDADFDISELCCDYMKKEPLIRYEKRTGRKMMTGEMAIDSVNRRIEYLEHGCNAFDLDRPKSTPIAFWTEQDKLMFLKKGNYKFSNAYGEIKELPNGTLYLTGELHTGCPCCLLGCHLEASPNRFQRMKMKQPMLYEYCISGGEYINGKWQPNDDGLGLGHVMNTLGIPYTTYNMNGIDYVGESQKYANGMHEQLKLAI